MYIYTFQPNYTGYITHIMRIPKLDRFEGVIVSIKRIENYHDIANWDCKSHDCVWMFPM